ncbi:MAG: peptidase T [Clostridia bacterium]|nr:peptidase T [Clostridia bacterium]MDY2930032.1 peptidase T [Clostridiaceae bacterium]
MRAYERLLHYVTFDTASDGESPTCPSTEKQTVLARELVREMKELGVESARMDENGYVYGLIPGNIPDFQGPTLGFIAHMDVVNDVPTAGIRPRIVKNYDGGDIVLNAQEKIVLSPRDFPELLEKKGKDLMVTDGTTLLGADDKAGIAEILTLAEELLSDPSFRHGPVAIAFTPDEEIGRGADRFDVAGFGADYAFTMDGGAFGELEYENFNAAALRVWVKGINIHPGSAKGKMKNAMRIAMEYEMMLPAGKKPEYTAGYDGFIHLDEMKGDVGSAMLRYILRDHDLDKLEEQKAVCRAAADFLNAKYGEGTVRLELRDGYRNMAKQIEPHRHLVDNAVEAIRLAGAEPCVRAIRGGTDGATLSYMGLPCPNLGTGGGNFHGVLEYCCIQEMDQAVACMKNILALYAKA